MKKIFISSDHAGYKLKDYIKNNIHKKNKIFDLGPFDTKSVDYPLYAHKLAKNVKKSKNNFGILICGSGTGMNIVANKHKNIRAALCFSVKSTKLSRLHNDANIITLGSRLISKKMHLIMYVFFWVQNLKGEDILEGLRKYNNYV